MASFFCFSLYLFFAFRCTLSASRNARNPAEVPVQFFDNGKASINTDVCAALGLDFTEVSKTLEPLCTKVEGLATGAEF